MSLNIPINPNVTTAEQLNRIQKGHAERYDSVSRNRKRGKQKSEKLFITKLCIFFQKRR